jgi:hypothetical protein
MIFASAPFDAVGDPPPPAPPTAEELAGAIRIDGLRHFAVLENGMTYLGFVDANGQTLGVTCNFPVTAQLLSQLKVIYQRAKEANRFALPKRSFFGLKNEEFFPTDAATVAMLAGNGAENVIVMLFRTPSGIVYSTPISPSLAFNIVHKLNNALSGIAVSDFTIDEEPWLNSLKTHGTPRAAKKSTTFFGQPYDTDILQGLGVLMIRANLLERSLIRLLAAVGGFEEEKASALFFSTVNNQARLGMITSLIPLAGMPSELATAAQESIETSNGVFGRRNNLVHGHWKFHKDKFMVDIIKSTAKKPASSFPVTADTILRLATDYRTAGFGAEVLANKILEWRGMPPLPPVEDHPQIDTPSPDEGQPPQHPQLPG